MRRSGAASLVVRVAAAAAGLVLLAACYMTRSDAENAARANRRERSERRRAMEAATRQAPSAAPLVGEALRSELSGHTHVFTYGSRPDGRPGTYTKWLHFRSDGALVATDTGWATDPAGRPGDRWWIDGERLCLVDGGFSQDASCYRVGRRPDGRLQYLIADPGGELDGLLTLVTDEVIEGPAPSAGE